MKFQLQFLHLRVEFFVFVFVVLNDLLKFVLKLTLTLLVIHGKHSEVSLFLLSINSCGHIEILFILK